MNLRFHLRTLLLLLTVAAVTLGLLCVRGYFTKGLWTVERVFEGVAQQFADDDSFTTHYYADCTANDSGEKITVHLTYLINDFASPKELPLWEGDVFRIVSGVVADTENAIELYDGKFVVILHRTNQAPKVGQEAIEY